MKHLTLIIHTNVQQDMSDQLRNLEQVSGFTFSHAEGHGIEVESDPFLSAQGCGKQRRALGAQRSMSVFTKISSYWMTDIGRTRKFLE
jgi:hypothetical protein